MTRSLGTSARADSQTSGAIAAVGWVAGVVFGYAAKAAHLTPGSRATALIMALDTIEHTTFGGSTPPPAYTAGADLNQRRRKPASTRILNLLINRSALSRASSCLPRSGRYG
jgi:hypothetical protein